MLNRLVECLKSKDLLNDTNIADEIIDPIPGKAPKLKRIEIDSRKVEPGDLYVAIKGQKTDGHRFISDVHVKGAYAAIVEHYVKDVDIPQIRVSNSREALAYLSDTFYGHPSKELKLIGITGTNGKTTTSYLVRDLLEANGLSVGIIGTNTYQWKGTTIPARLTTPESHQINSYLRQMVNEGIEACVMEASSHSVDMNRITALDFDVVAFTNLSHDHLDFYKTMENYFRSKRQLFINVSRQSNDKSMAVINIDDDWGKRLISEITDLKIISYGMNDPADIAITDFVLGQKNTSFTLFLEDRLFPLETSLLGEHNLYNILTALGILKALNITFNVDKVQNVIKNISIKGRLESIDEGQDFAVLNDYAHTPDALEKILQNCNKIKGHGRIIIVFGAGGDRDRDKRPIMGRVVAKHSDVMILTSDNPRTEDPQNIIDEVKKGIPEDTDFIECIDRRKAIFRAIHLAKPSDIVIIAGKGHEDYQIIGKKKTSFDDSKVVREALKQSQ